jgi:hypothetical protein
VPVMLIKPVEACKIKSIAGSSRDGPSCPYPEIEQ